MPPYIQSWPDPLRHKSLLSQGLRSARMTDMSCLPHPSTVTRLVRDVAKTLDAQSTSPYVHQSTDSTKPDYASGLAGVNLKLDQTLTKYLLLSMFLVALVVLGMRVAHLSTAHIRHIYCIHASKEEQRYWSFDKNWWLPWLKRELGKASNYGTLPGRAHTGLLLLYIISNIVYCIILPYEEQETAKTIAELRGRAGVLATVNMIPLVLLAGRNNPLIKYLKISFDTFNLFHRWIGRIVILESLVHVCAWYVNYSASKKADPSFEPIAGNVFLISGIIAVVAMVVVVMQSLSVVRHAFYETFLLGHQILVFFIFAGVYVHLDVDSLPALPFIRTVIITWIIERLLRMIWIIYLNISWRSRRTTKVIIEALPGRACRVTFQLPRHTIIRPGSHIYAYLPKFSGIQNHPFSVAWTNPESEPPTGPVVLEEHESQEESTGMLNKETIDNAISGPQEFHDVALKTPNYLERQSTYATCLTRRQAPPTSVSLICATRTGMTKAIYDAAMAAPTRTIFTSGFLEGPYDGHDDLRSYGTVVMFAGGAGITHHLVQIRHLIAGANSRTVATRKIVLAWSVRDLEALVWVQPWMDEILKMPGRREILTMKLFVTKPRGKNDYASPSKSIDLQGKRCDPGQILDDILRRPPSEGGRVGACFVSVCGPGAFADEVRRAVRDRISYGALELSEHSFTW